MLFKLPPTRRFPWMVLFFLPLLYFALFDQTAFIPSTRTFSVILVLIILVPWLTIKIWRRQSWPATSLDFLFIGVVILNFTSAILSPSFRLTFYQLWLLLLSILIFYFMLDQLQAGHEDFLWQALFLVATLILALASYEFSAWYFGWLPQLGFEISWPQVAGWSLPPHPRRLSFGLLTVPVAPPFSAYVALFIPLALGLALSTRRGLFRLGLAGFILLSLVILLLTFSRTGLVTLLVSLVSFLALAWLTKGGHAPPLRQPQNPAGRGKGWGVGWKSKWFMPAMFLIMALFGLLLLWNWDLFAREVFENRTGSNNIRLDLVEAALGIWRDHPFLGIGPGLFGQYYRNYIPANSFFLLNLSAHSFYLQLLAETGLAGVILAGLIAVITGRAIYQRLLHPKASSQQWRLIGAASTLLGYFISAGIEQLWWLPFFFPLCLAGAYALAKNIQPSVPHPHSHPRSYQNVGLPIFYLILLLALGGAWLYVNTMADRFVALTQTVEPGRELTTIEELNRLQQLDPGLPIYTLGQGYYLGRHVINTLSIAPCSLPPSALPASEQMTLAQAIQQYETSLHPLKAHPLYWANLASLYWLQRQPELAQDALRQAIQLSNISDPNIEIYLLNSGCYYELSGDTAQATERYSQLLQGNPDLAALEFWQTSEFRVAHLPDIINTAIKHAGERYNQLLLSIALATATNNQDDLEKWQQELITTFSNSPEALHLKAEKLLQQKNYSESRALAHQLEDYHLLGQIALASGDSESAQANFKIALFLDPDQAEARFALAQMAVAAGQTPEAINQLKHLTLPVERPNTLDSKFIYGYPTNFPLYNLLLLLKSPPLRGQPFDLLAKIYEDAGQPDAAQAVRDTLASYDPYLKN
ncbi:MAG: O-antigen ligase family protein [Anaerolineae bacterium]